MTPVVWGVLGAARIAIERVIPAMRQSESCEVRAIASHDSVRAVEAAGSAGVPVSFGSYEDLLADPDIDAVYIPLPNHLHVEWSIRALEAGKHVLCELPEQSAPPGACEFGNRARPAVRRPGSRRRLRPPVRSRAMCA